MGTKNLLRFVVDCFILSIAFLVTRRIIIEKGDIFFDSPNQMLLVNSFFAWYIIGKSNHLYGDYVLKSYAFELTALVKTIVIHSLVIVFLFFFFYPKYLFPRTFTIVYTGVIFLIMPVQKYIYKKILFGKVRKVFKNVIIVGNGKLGKSFYREVVSNRLYGWNLIGFIDDVPAPELKNRYLGGTYDLENVFKKYEVDEVVVALPNSAVQKIEETIVISEKYAKRVRIIPDYYRFSSGNFSIGSFGNFPIITVRPSPLDESEHIVLKRMFDLVFSSLFLLFIFSWLYPIIALVIKLDSKGPVLFRQERWGEKNQKIICYKFRSMVLDSKDVDHGGKYVQAHKNDPRITKTGAFLRKTSLDELPQFFNVFLGSMSVVGPRPHPIPLNIESKDSVENYMLRHMVKPGITGWAQVNGHRGETKKPGQMQQRVNYDLWYIENWSFWLDCQIIFQTVISVVKGDKNAY